MRRVRADTLETESQTSFTGFGKKYGQIYIFLHWADLHNGLYELALGPSKEGIPQTKIELASNVVKVDPVHGSITLEDGRTVRKDLIVIADGAHVSTSIKMTAFRVIADHGPYSANISRQLQE